MPIRRDNESFHESAKSGALRSWVMVVLTLTLVLLYAATLLGWLRPLAEGKVAMRLEPIVFVIVGYCFGRLPAQQNEKALKDEISRHAQQVNATQGAKEKALENLAGLEERVNNIKELLAPLAARQQLNERSRTLGTDDQLNGSLADALKILNSY